MFEFIAQNLKLAPVAKTSGSAGMDVRAKEDCEIEPGQTELIGTGVKILNCDENIYFDLAIRSSLRVAGLTDLGLGIIDSDYRKEIGVIIHNTTKDTYKINKMDRIAQLVPRLKVQIPGKYILNEERKGGFGSTNKGK